MAKHTPGQWFISGNGPQFSRYKIVDRNGKSICAFPSTQDRDIEEKAANASVIAAAPDMLAALQAIVADAGKTRMANLDADLPQDAALMLAAAAIARATA